MLLCQSALKKLLDSLLLSNYWGRERKKLIFVFLKKTIKLQTMKDHPQLTPLKS